MGSSTEVMRDISKLITYPVLGNLSHKLRSGLQKKVGEKLFNAGSAAGVSILTNLVLYPLVAYTFPLFPDIEDVVYQYPNLFQYSNLLVGFIVWEAEMVVRIVMFENGKYLPSLPGKIVSLPIEWATNFYDRTKKGERVDW